MPTIKLDKSEFRAVVKLMNEGLEYVHEGRTIKQVEKLALMKALKKMSPKDHWRIIRFMEREERGE